MFKFKVREIERLSGVIEALEFTGLQYRLTVSTLHGLCLTAKKEKSEIGIATSGLTVEWCSDVDTFVGRVSHELQALGSEMLAKREEYVTPTLTELPQTGIDPAHCGRENCQAALFDGVKASDIVTSTLEPDEDLINGMGRAWVLKAAGAPYDSVLSVEGKWEAYALPWLAAYNAAYRKHAESQLDWTGDCCQGCDDGDDYVGPLSPGVTLRKNSSHCPKPLRRAGQ